jgi:hypothetical protein
MLGERLYLFQEHPDEGFSFSDRSLGVRARLWDAIQDSDNADLQFERLMELGQEVRTLNEPALVWRVAYLLGLIPYSTYADQPTGDGGVDKPTIVGWFTLVPDSDDGQHIEQRILSANPTLVAEPSRIKRFARFAERQFAAAANTLIDAMRGELSRLPHTRIAIARSPTAYKSALYNQTYDGRSGGRSAS